MYASSLFAGLVQSGARHGPMCLFRCRTTGSLGLAFAPPGVMTSSELLLRGLVRFRAYSQLPLQPGYLAGLKHYDPLYLFPLILAPGSWVARR
jgi:hypothetical protein